MLKNFAGNDDIDRTVAQRQSRRIAGCKTDVAGRRMGLHIGNTPRRGADILLGPVDPQRMHPLA